MRNSANITKQDFINIQNINNQRLNTLFNLNSNSNNSVKNNPVLEIIKAERGENFSKYVEGLGLANDPDLVILSSLHHYYYDAEEMKNVRTVVNLKELNRIKEIKSLFHSIFHILPQKSNFIGCFVDNEKINGFVLRNSLTPFQNRGNVAALESGIISQIPFLNKLYSFIDSKTNTYLSRRIVSLLLENYGLKVLDMTDLDGFTYFHSQKIKATDN